MSNSSISTIDKTLSVATTPGQSGPGSNGKEGILNISQSSKAGASPTASLMKSSGHWWRGGAYPSAEIQLVYSTVPVDWADNYMSSYNYF